MKQPLLITAIAYSLLLGACSDQALYIKAPMPDHAGSLPSVRSTVQQTDPVSTVEPRDIISWIAYSLLSSVLAEHASDTRLYTPNTGVDQRAGQPHDQVDGAAANDPWGIHAKAALQAPALPAALTPRNAFVPARSR